MKHHRCFYNRTDTVSGKHNEGAGFRQPKTPTHDLIFRAMLKQKTTEAYDVISLNTGLKYQNNKVKNRTHSEDGSIAFRPIVI